VRQSLEEVIYCGREQHVAVSFSKHPSSDITAILLHGLGCTKESFTGIIDAGLAGRTSVLALDFPGFGESDKPDDFAYKMEELADVTRLVIGRFATERTVLVAHSMGGAVGLLLAENLPNLEMFINLEGNLIPEDAGIISRSIAQQSEEEFVGRGYNTILEQLESSGVEDLRAWAGWFKMASPIAVYRSACSLVEWSDSNKLIERFNKLPKSAYVYGDQADTTNLRRQFGAGVVTRSIAGAGHFMMLDNPGELCAVICDNLGT
jgi:pimeloyl-ACP methyl ester carboxylesterase